MARLCILALFWSLLSIVPSQAQWKTLLDENFDNNRNEWLTGELDGATARVENGKYILSKTGDNAWYFFMNVDLDQKQDFEIEAVIRQTSGVIDHGYGFTWGTADVNNTYITTISSNGYTKVYQWIGGTYSAIQDWKTCDAVKPLGEFNTMTLRKEADALSLFVNGRFFASMVASNHPFKGVKVGFVLNDVMSIEVDRLVVRQRPAQPVHLLADAQHIGKKENLGSGVNSESPDLSPIITADGKTLYLCRYPHPGNTPPIDRGDIWVSTWQGNEWGEAKNIGAPLNNEGSNFVVSVTPDGNTLLLGNTYKSDGSADGAGLSQSSFTGTGWSIPQTVVIDSFYNTNRYVSNCLSPDSKVLITAIERNDGYGDQDLCVSFLKPNGSWSVPRNMGATLNTVGSDCTPYIAADGVTLYYATNGKPGYGDVDIFVTRRLDSTWMHWSEPENLGPAVNSSSFDAYFTVSARGDYAYLVSYENTRGEGDIFRLTLPESARPQPVVLVSGKVLDAKTKRPLGAGVVYERLPSGAEAGIAHSNPADGSYKVSLPAGSLYGFRAEAQGYYPVSEQLDTRELKTYNEINKNLYLVPVEVDQAVRLNNVFFDSGKFNLRPESAPELDRLVRFLQNNPTVEIEIAGHTDNVGNDQANKVLSQNRVNSVRQYLESHNVLTRRLRSVGYGETRPVASNDTEEGRQTNRRVEFFIRKK